MHLIFDLGVFRGLCYPRNGDFYLMSDSQNRKRKLERVAQLLIQADEHEFDVALRRGRELAAKLGVSFKDVMLSNIKISIQKKDETYELENKIENLKNEVKELKEDRDHYYNEYRRIDQLNTKYLHELPPKRKSKVDDKNKIKYLRDSLQAFIRSDEKKRQEIEKLKSMKEFVPIISSELIARFIDHYSIVINKSNWISTTNLYNYAKKFFEESPISIKRFSIEFGKLLNIEPVVGGKLKKNRGFQVYSRKLKSEDL